MNPSDYVNYLNRHNPLNQSWTTKDDFLNAIQSWIDQNASMDEISLLALDMQLSPNLPGELEDFVGSLTVLSEPGFEMSTEEIRSRLEKLKADS